MPQFLQKPTAQPRQARRLGPAYAFSPAADDRLARERQVQETSADFKGEGVLQGVAVDDEGYIVLFAQQLSQVCAVLSDGSPCRLEKVREGDVCGLHTEKEDLMFLEMRRRDMEKNHTVQLGTVTGNVICGCLMGKTVSE